MSEPRYYNDEGAQHQDQPVATGGLDESIPAVEVSEPALVASRKGVADALWNAKGMSPNVHRNHGYDAFCPVCMGNPPRIADALLAAGVFREQPTREVLARAAHKHYCVSPEAETHDLDELDFDKADEVLEILALINGGEPNG